MAYPVDLYVALSDAPAGVEHQFQTAQPVAHRNGAALVMRFAAPDADDAVWALSGEVEAVLDGFDYFWAVLRDGEVQGCDGDVAHLLSVPNALVAH